MKIYFIEEPNFTTHTAGSKPRNDFKHVLISLEYEGLTGENVSSKVFMPSDDIVIYQHTLTEDWHSHFLNFQIENNMRRILLVHDMPSIRNEDSSGLIAEIKFLNQFNCLIVHNEKMKERLVREGVVVPMVILELFDYLLPQELIGKLEKRKISKEVIFAGNLNPKYRKFIYHRLSSDTYILNLYGPELDGKLNSENTNYYGSYPPDELPIYLKGAFGLIWNGKSGESCEGSIAEYIKYFTQHKVSLYIACKIPIICWEEDIISKYIIENQIGFTIKSLSEIDKKIADISSETYDNMILNLEKIATKVVNGYHFKKAIQEAIRIIQ